MKKLATVLMICATLTACGGGGGGSQNSNNKTDRPSVALTTQNYEAAATEAMGSSSTLLGNSSNASNLLPGANVQTAPTITDFVLSKLPDLIKSLGAQRPQLIGAIITDTQPCTSGGSLSMSSDDLNGNDSPDPGDYVTVSANDCIDSLSGAKINGQMTITFTKYSKNSANPDAFDASLIVQSNQFRSEINGVTTATQGSFDMDISSIYVLGQNGMTQQSMTVNVSAASLDYSVTTAGTTKVYEYRDYILKSTTYNKQVTLSITGSINIPSLGSNTATIQTIKNFVSPVTSNVSFSLSYPTDGIALITFKQGGKIRATANGTSNALIELDQENDGKFETSKQVPWSDIL
ncbi:hypothetical protein [Limnohabitans sp. DM1]|uniref:hypothetical protein n=1 Tax=Limnohabitans sp. DM1 TaxID=1597955 RepID=UPI000B1F5954|nr:hypothetical protein [Limnohabitans sp. DM1]